MKCQIASALQRWANGTAAGGKAAWPSSPMSISQAGGRGWQSMCVRASGESEVPGGEKITAEAQLLPLSLSASPKSCQWACSVAQGQCSDLPARAISVLGWISVKFSIPTGWLAGAVWPPHILMCQPRLPEGSRIPRDLSALSPQYKSTVSSGELNRWWDLTNAQSQEGCKFTFC